MNLHFNVQRQLLFAAPIYLVNIEGADDLNHRILDEFHASRERHWHTHLINGRYENTMACISDVPSVNLLLDVAEKLGSEIAGQPIGIGREGKSPGFWFNQTETLGGTTSIHNHAPGPILSGVYYIKCPEHCGNLMFTKSRSFTLDHTTAKFTPDGGYFKNVELVPREGLMVLFPSWLDHAVTPNTAGCERTALAFNLSAPGPDPCHLQIEAVVTA